MGLPPAMERRLGNARSRADRSTGSIGPRSNSGRSRRPACRSPLGQRARAIYSLVNRFLDFGSLRSSRHPARELSRRPDRSHGSGPAIPLERSLPPRTTSPRRSVTWNCATDYPSKSDTYFHLPDFRSILAIIRPFYTSTLQVVNFSQPNIPSGDGTVLSVRREARERSCRCFSIFRCRESWPSASSPSSPFPERQVPCPTTTTRSPAMPPGGTTIRSASWRRSTPAGSPWSTRRRAFVAFSSPATKTSSSHMMQAASRSVRPSTPLRS